MTEINPTMARNRAYTEYFRNGMYAACNGVTREQANAHAVALPVMEGDAYLAGYYAEKRRMRMDADGASP